MRRWQGWAIAGMLLATGALLACGGGSVAVPGPDDDGGGSTPGGGTLAATDTVTLECAFTGVRSARLPVPPGGSARGTWRSLDTTVVRMLEGEVAVAVRPGRAYVQSSVPGSRPVLVEVRFDDDRPPLLIAHRGFAGRYPENTMEAFTRALADGAGAIEFDVHLSADGTPVVIHDQTLDRTTTGTGRVAAATDAYLRTLDACPRSALRPCRLPTLADVVTLLAQHPEARAVLDLKTPLTALQVAAVLDPMAAMGVAPRVLFMTSDTTVLARAAASDPLVPLGLLYYGGAEPAPALAVQARDQRAAVRPLRWWLDVADESTMNALESRCVEAVAWTATTQAEADQLLQAGIRSIIANVPLSLSTTR